MPWPLTCVFAFQDSVRVWDWCSPGGFVWERVRKVRSHFAAVLFIILWKGRWLVNQKNSFKGLVYKEDEGPAGIILFRGPAQQSDRQNYTQQSFSNSWVEHVTWLQHDTSPPPSSLVIVRIWLDTILSTHRPLCVFLLTTPRHHHCSRLPTVRAWRDADHWHYSTIYDTPAWYAPCWLCHRDLDHRALSGCCCYLWADLKMKVL